MPVVKSERVDLRLAPENKSLLQEAAMSLGVTVTEFIVDVAVDAAKAVRAERENQALSDRDRALFLEMLDSEAGPNPALRSAYERVKAQRGD